MIFKLKLTVQGGSIFYILMFEKKCVKIEKTNIS